MTFAVMFVGVVAVSATSASADCVVTATLRVGSTGAGVQCLQSKLGLGADGSFGPLTKAGVVAFQVSHNLSADGIVGPMTASEMNSGATAATFPAGCMSNSGYSTSTGMSCAGGSFPAGCMSTSGYSTVTGMPCSGGSNLPAGCTSTSGFSPVTGMSCAGGSTPSNTGPLAGSAGEISDVNRLSQYSGEEVGAAQKDVKVLGFEVKATKEGDIALKSVKVSFVISNASGSTKLDDYADSINVWQGSTKVGSADSADFNKDSTGHYSKTVSLSNSIVRSDATEKFYVSVNALSNLDSGDIDSEVATIGIDSIRFEDGSGVVSTDSTAGDLPISGVSVAFVSFSTASDTKLKVSLNNTPVAGVVKVDANDNTDHVVLLKGKLKLEGTSDVWLDALPVTLTSTNTLGSITAITGSVTLKLGNNTYTESTGTNCVSESDFSTPDTCSTSGSDSAGILFDNLDYTISAGQTVDFTVEAEINDLDATVGASVNFDATDTLSASLLSNDRAYLVAENEDGDQLTDSTEMTGSAVGEVQTFQGTGIAVALVSSTGTVAMGASGSPDLGTYTLTFDVTAFGGDMYIDGTKPLLTGTDAIDLDIIPATGGTGTQDAVITSSTGATRTGTINTTARFLVREGETERFTITSVVTPTVAGGLYAVKLASLSYDDADNDITDITGQEYTTNLTDFVSPSVNLKLTN